MPKYYPNTTTANYPFGMLMPGRTYSSEEYGYGFNGKEKDDEVSNQGNCYDYGFRIYNSRLGKFLSIDPLAKSYSWNSPFAYAENSPIAFIDLDGLERFYAADGLYLGQFGEDNNIKVVEYDYVIRMIIALSRYTNPKLIEERQTQLKVVQSIDKNHSQRLCESSNSVQSNILTKINEEIKSTYKLAGDRIYVDMVGVVMKKEDGSEIEIIGAAESYYNLNSNEGLVSINNSCGDYYVLLMMLEHEKNHNEEVKSTKNHPSTLQPKNHYDVQWNAHLKYGRKSEDAMSYSKQLLSKYLNDMKRDLNNISDKDSAIYRKKFIEYSTRKDQYEKEFNE